MWEANQSVCVSPKSLVTVIVLVCLHFSTRILDTSLCVLSSTEIILSNASHLDVQFSFWPLWCKADCPLKLPRSLLDDVSLLILVLRVFFFPFFLSRPVVFVYVCVLLCSSLCPTVFGTTWMPEGTVIRGHL